MLAVAALFQLVDAAQVMSLGFLRGMQDSGWPMVYAVVGYWVIGMPANDGDHATWFLILEPDGSHAFHQLGYDHGAAARAMRSAGLAEGYAAGLETGLWPSLDILPEAERRATGRPTRAVA